VFSNSKQLFFMVQSIWYSCCHLSSSNSYLISCCSVLIVEEWDCFVMDCFWVVWWFGRWFSCLLCRMSSVGKSRGWMWCIYRRGCSWMGSITCRYLSSGLVLLRLVWWKLWRVVGL
jgi:hypothetical protein